MIIRITVGDNDYTETLKTLCTDLFTNTLFSLQNDRDYGDYKKFFALFNPNTNKNVNEEKEFITSKFSNTIKSYIYSCVSNKEVADYLITHLSVDIVDTYSDMWENREVLYYFTKNNIILEN